MRKSIESLKETQAQLKSGFHDRSLNDSGRIPELEDQLAGGSDDAPEVYRDLVAEYFKALNNDSR